MAEVHVMGSILGASDFSEPKGLYCRYKLETSLPGVAPWQLLGGQVDGCTQVDASGGGGVDAVWDQPLDIHLGCSTPVGWPRLRVEVWSRDEGETNVLAGYGFCNVPSTPGVHQVDIVTWVPAGTWHERLSRFFLGTKPQLKDSEVVSVTSPGEGRFGLKTQSSGIVYVQFEILMTSLAAYGVITS